MARMTTARDKKQAALREDLWPGSEARIWKASGEKGFCCLPRILPLLLRLMNDKSIIGGKSGDCGPVYLELVARDRGQGIVELGSEGEHAYLSGYTGSRAIRTWKERVAALARAGFIEVMSRPNQIVGTVLIVHPHVVVSNLRAAGKVDDEWWGTYERLQREYGASVPKLEPRKLRVVSKGTRDSRSTVERHVGTRK